MDVFCKNEMGRVAYIAPEIPALSATFVYNEILALERFGVSVVPISVHEPAVAAKDNTDIEGLALRTHYLYRRSLFQFVAASVRILLRRPFAYLRTMACMMRDVISVGPFSHTGIGLIYRFFASATVAEILLRERCTHLHAHFAHIPTDIAMYGAGMAGLPYSFTSHANDLFQRGWLLKEKVDRAKFGVTISEYNKHFMQQQGVRIASIHVIHCGVDAANIKKLQRSTAGDRFTIGALGRAVEKKGFDHLLSALSLLKQQGLNLQLYLAGDGPLLPELKQQAARLGIENDVIFCGAIAHDKVAIWMGELDIFVLPCKQDSNGDMDGIPVVLMEAMMAQVPVISTRLSGIPELVIDGVTGLLTRPGDPEALAHAIISLHDDQELRQRLVNAAVPMVQAQFDLNKNAEQLAKLFLGKVR